MPVPILPFLGNHQATLTAFLGHNAGPLLYTLLPRVFLLCKKKKMCLTQHLLLRANSLGSYKRKFCLVWPLRHCWKLEVLRFRKLRKREGRFGLGHDPRGSQQRCLNYAGMVRSKWRSHFTFRREINCLSLILPLRGDLGGHGYQLNLRALTWEAGEKNRWPHR